MFSLLSWHRTQFYSVFAFLSFPLMEPYWDNLQLESVAWGVLTGHRDRRMENSFILAWHIFFLLPLHFEQEMIFWALLAFPVFYFEKNLETFDKVEIVQKSTTCLLLIWSCWHFPIFILWLNCLYLWCSLVSWDLWVMFLCKYRGTMVWWVGNMEPDHLGLYLALLMTFEKLLGSVCASMFSSIKWKWVGPCITFRREAIMY